MQKGKMDYIAYIKESLRGQRHDFMNYFQIVYAYIQLGKTNEAIDSINKVISLNMSLSNIYNLSLFHVSVYLDRMVRELDDLEHEIIIKVNNHTDYDLRLIDNEKEILDDLDCIFKGFMDSDDVGIINIEVEEFEDSIRFLFVGKNKSSTTYAFTIRP